MYKTTKRARLALEPHETRHIFGHFVTGHKRVHYLCPHNYLGLGQGQT
jgi:hypothetical protein